MSDDTPTDEELAARLAQLANTEGPDEAGDPYGIPDDDGKDD